MFVFTKDERTTRVIEVPLPIQVLTSEELIEVTPVLLKDKKKKVVGPSTIRLVEVYPAPKGRIPSKRVYEIDHMSSVKQIVATARKIGAGIEKRHCPGVEQHIKTKPKIIKVHKVKRRKP